MIWRSPTDQCDVYGLCGAYGSCNSDNLQSCSCLEGFSLADKRAWDSHDWWSSGCVRQSPLTCSTQKGSTDEFIDSGATLPNDSASSYPAPTKVDCQKACLRNCSCTGFRFAKHPEKQFRAEISSLGSIQHGNLIRLRGFCAE
ncbi:hypothetical protein SUGI_0543900 [Cryptomeria japonica]|nr:hypothetical protein SUGI_0543900 [Cryptomeria japonica]